MAMMRRTHLGHGPWTGHDLSAEHGVVQEGALERIVDDSIERLSHAHRELLPEHAHRCSMRTSHMKVKRSCQLAVFGRRALDAKYATAPTLATKAREYAEVAVKMGGGVDMVRDVGEGWEGEKQPSRVLCCGILTGVRVWGTRSLTRSHERRVYERVVISPESSDDSHCLLSFA